MKKKPQRKMDVHFSSVNMNFETPPDLFKLLNEEFRFNLDAAADAKNALCKNFISEGALTKSWSKRSRDAKGKRRAVFCNPPYGRTLRRWVKKAIEEAKRTVVVLLIPARPDTIWFRLVAEAGELRLITGRLYFRFKGKAIRHKDAKGKLRETPAPFPAMVAVLGPKVKPSIRIWDWKEAG